MKKWIALIMIFALALTAAACSAGDTQNAPANETTSVMSADELKAHMDDVLQEQGYKGIVYLSRNGEVVYQSVTGTDENGDNLTVASNMYIGSVSKQFCAAAILILRNEGKLSVDDTLEKYFPEYETGKDITLKNLLTMRSGILDMVNQGNVTGLSSDRTEEENVAAIKEWIFSRPLQFEPDSSYAYSNSNFFLLANVVEQVSGQHYIDFVRERIFEPLGMTHSGFVDEIGDAPSWMNGLSTEIYESDAAAKGLTKGAGDVVTTAPDMDAWMTGLSGGKVISAESYREMTADYSPDSGASYGYGLMQMFGGGVGHGGNIGTYSSVDYINEKHGYHLFCVSNKSSMSGVSNSLPSLLLEDVFNDEEQS